MELEFSEQQQMLRKMARDFLATECLKKLVREMEDDAMGHPGELWRKMAELGWHGLVFPEEYGGGGGTFLDLAVLLEEMGRALLPGPFYSTIVLGGLAVLDSGNEEQKREFLPRICRGDLVMTSALSQDEIKTTHFGINASVASDGRGYIINGTKLFISYAHVCDWIVCPAKIKGDEARLKGDIILSLIDQKNPGVSCDLLATIAHDKQCNLVLRDVKVPKEYVIQSSQNGLERTLQKSTVAKCVEMAGQALQVLEMSVDYAKTRMQFGRPIGSFQAIQHHCANMAVDVEAARLLAYRAAWLISEGIPCTKEVSSAKIWLNEACRRVMSLGHQIHGAIGFTWDHDMQLYSRRIVAARLSFGDSDFHREKVALFLVS